MPIYDYVCRDCKEEFELLILSSQQPQCEVCGGQQLDKLLSVPASPRGHQNTPGPCDGPPPGANPCGSGGCGLPECGF